MNLRVPYFAVLLNIGLISLAAHLTTKTDIPRVRMDYSFQSGIQDPAAASSGLLFVQRRSENGFQLTYGWKDFGDKSYTLSFAIADELISRAQSEIGYDPAELEQVTQEKLLPSRRDMIRDLKSFTRKEIKGSGLAEFISVENEDPLKFNLKMSAPPDRREEIRDVFLRITKRIAERQERLLKKIEKEKTKIHKEFIRSRGLRYYGKKVGVDYGRAVDNNKRRIAHVLEKMKELSPKNSIQDLLSITLSFIQEVSYGIPPFVENNKIILGYWPPPKVLAHNFGDCDSKGVTFVSMWANFKRYPLLLIKIPKHMFIGLAVPSTRESGLEINGFRYTLCEVTGPEKTPPGMITPYSRLYLDSGNYSYELIR